jgi:hypothetical protein
MSKTHDDIGLAIDMLDADKLRHYAEKIEIHGSDISHWADRRFVIERLRDIAGRIETTVREVGTLRELAGQNAVDALPRATDAAVTFDCGCTFAGNAPPIECPSHPAPDAKDAR